VPKTLDPIPDLRWVIETDQFFNVTTKPRSSSRSSTQILARVADSRIRAMRDQPAGCRAPVRFHRMQDFNTYYITRYGFRRARSFLRSQSACHRNQRDGPGSPPVDRRNEYDLATIAAGWKSSSIASFRISQSAGRKMNGPLKLWLGGSLSPRV